MSSASQSDTFSAQQWSSFLSGRLARPVRVRFGRARRQVVVARPEGSSPGALLAVRMNAVFAQAPADVREATATWLRSGRRAPRACGKLDAWIESKRTEFAALGSRRPRLRTQGAHHDLEQLAAPLFEREFAPGELAPPPKLTWGRRGRARRSLLLGSYDPEEHLVRVHPVLDQEAVPRLFVRYVLFHELLHAASTPLPADRSGGRRPHHDPRFLRRERAYRDYDLAMAWQQENLDRLLRSARTGKPMRPGRLRRSNRSGDPAREAWTQGLFFAL